MDKERRNDQEKGDKGENNLETTQNKTEKLRLDSYVNIEDEDIPIEENKDQEGNHEKKTNNKITGTEGCPIGSNGDTFSDHYPCGVCGQELGKGYKGRSVFCTGCQHWCHLSKCSGLTSDKQYKKKDYRCPSCVSKFKDTPQIDNPPSPIGQSKDENNTKNADKIISITEKTKVKSRKGSIFDNSPIITGSREFPEIKKKIKRKRINREEGTSESPEKKSDTEEKSPISKKSKIEDTKKRNKNNLRKNNEHQKQRDPADPYHKKDTPVDEGKIKYCIDCSKKYNADDTNAEITCIVCNAGKHGCLKEVVYESNGSVWMCGECMMNMPKGNNRVKENINLKEKEKERNKTNNEEALKKNTENENILEYQGANITEKDIKTLENGQWICDEIISLYLAFMREDENTKDAKILFVNPSATYILKECADKKTMIDLKQDLRINEMEWVFYPINDNKNSDSVGGTHWSLLLFCKKENKYYHYDPIEGKNKDHAKELILNTLDLNNFKLGALPEYRQVKCPKQENSYDCGPYIMLYIRELVNNIILEKETNRIHFTGNEATKFREQMREIIQYRITETEKTKRPEDEVIKTNSKKDTPTDKKISWENKKTVCEDWVRSVCNNSKNCKYEHPILCTNWISRGDCWGLKNKQCKFYHPNLCLQHLGQEDCRNGSRCRERHIQRDKENINQYRSEVCRFWAIGKCSKNDCRFAHPVICRDMIRNGQCNKMQCKTYHPKICKENKKHELCRWGDKCRFRHINRVTQNTPNKDYFHQYRNGESIQQHHEMRRNQTVREGREAKTYGRLKNNYEERLRNQPETNTEDFLWSRLNIWEKRQIIGLMTNKRTEMMYRK